MVKDGGAWRVPATAGFDPGMEMNAHQLVKFPSYIKPQQKGYIYIWVSNESENTKVWFDDLKVTHTKSRVIQASDYYAWGSTMREQRTPENDTYRYGYQGEYAEKDEETGWNHFELREYDAIIGRWTSTDPEGQFYSPYLGMGNNLLNGVDPDGALWEWDLNTTTGKYVKIGDKGGATTQYIHFDGGKNPEVTIEASTFFVGKVFIGDMTYQYTAHKFDLWSSIPEDYQGRYSAFQLVSRYKAKGIGLKSIEEQETQGVPADRVIMNAHDFAWHLKRKYGSTSSFVMAAETGMMPYPVPSNLEDLIPAVMDAAKLFKANKAMLPSKNMKFGDTKMPRKTSPLITPPQKFH